MQNNCVALKLIKNYSAFVCHFKTFDSTSHKELLFLRRVPAHKTQQLNDILILFNSTMSETRCIFILMQHKKISVLQSEVSL